MELSRVLQTVNGKMHEKCLVQAEQILTNFNFFPLKTPHSHCLSPGLHHLSPALLLWPQKKSFCLSSLPCPQPQAVSFFKCCILCLSHTQISHITPQLKTFAKLPEVELLIIFLSSIISSFPDHIMSVLVRALLIAGYRYSPKQLKRSGRLLQGCQELLERQ